MTSHDIICLHTMVGFLTSTDSMFRAHGFKGLESHFGVGGQWGQDLTKDLDGVVFQWQDVAHTADANLDGNHRVISIETADNAPSSASNLKPWTEKQLEAITNLVAWLCKEYDIPPVLVSDTKPGRRGIAFHRQGIDPWRVSGGERWSASRGKECPGDARISQLKNVIIPAVSQLLNGPVPPPKDTEVALTDADAKTVFNTQYRDFLDTDGDPNTPRTLLTMAQALLLTREDAYKANAGVADANTRLETVEATLSEVLQTVAAILDIVTPVVPPPPAPSN
jgi:hypothetical protein